jgi:hypothetical protein
MDEGAASICCQEWVADYFRSNFYINHVGQLLHVCPRPSDRRDRVTRVLWSADYPFEAVGDAANWIDAVSMTEKTEARSSAASREAIQAANLTRPARLWAAGWRKIRQENCCQGRRPIHASAASMSLDIG